LRECVFGVSVEFPQRIEVSIFNNCFTESFDKVLVTPKWT
jgi:hypothetical protein